MGSARFSGAVLSAHMGEFWAKVAQLVDASTHGGGVFLSDPRGSAISARPARFEAA